MFGCFNGPRGRPATTRRRVRLAVEALELRDCPSGVELFAPPILPDDGQMPDAISLELDGELPAVIVPAELDQATMETAPADPIDFAGPSQALQTLMMVDFGAIEGPAQIWTFTGKILHDNPTTLVVTFTGLPSLEGRTVVVDEDGVFTLTLQLAEGEEGTVTATTTDPSGLQAEAWDIVRQTR